MRTIGTFVLAAALAATGSGLALAQEKAPAKKAPADKQAPAPAAAAPAKPAGPPLPSPPPNFQYAADGRRDPFISLVNRGTDARASGQPNKPRPEGVPGLDAAQITVRGILLSRGSYIAMVSGADGKVHTIRAGDKLFDGVVRAITPQAVVILQEVNDPLSLEKQREVRKFLRGGDEVK